MGKIHTIFKYCQYSKFLTKVVYTMENSEKRRFFDVSSAALHIMAMFFMLLDHAWATVVPGAEWMTSVGRIAFPIFAFLLTEGYFHTHNFKKYMLRLLFFAVISEIPFNLMYGGQAIYIYHQNVLWSFLISLSGMWFIDHIKKRGKPWLTVLTAALTIFLCAVAGQLLMVDYYGAGILMVFVFYLFHGRKWWCILGQLAGMYFVNIHLLGSMYYTAHIFGLELHLYQQGLALLALIPIWLYKGRQGYHSKAFKYFCYAFYPAHIALLVLTAYLIG